MFGTACGIAVAVEYLYSNRGSAWYGDVFPESNKGVSRTGLDDACYAWSREGRFVMAAYRAPSQVSIASGPKSFSGTRAPFRDSLTASVDGASWLLNRRHSMMHGSASSAIKQSGDGTRAYAATDQVRGSADA